MTEVFVKREIFSAETILTAHKQTHTHTHIHARTHARTHTQAPTHANILTIQSLIYTQLRTGRQTLQTDEDRSTERKTRLQFWGKKYIETRLRATTRGRNDRPRYDTNFLIPAGIYSMSPSPSRHCMWYPSPVMQPQPSSMGDERGNLCKHWSQVLPRQY